MADPSRLTRLKQLAGLQLAVAGLGLGLTACALGSEGSGAATGTVDVRLQVGVPTYGELGLASASFRLPRALTARERRNVRLSVTGRRPDEIVAAAATVSSDGREVLVVAGLARRKSRGPLRRHGLSLEGVAALPGDGLTSSGEGYLILAPSFVRDAAAASSSPADAHAPEPGEEATAVEAQQAAPSQTDPDGPSVECRSLERSLRRSGEPVLVSGARYVRLPRRRLANGSSAVPNSTRAGLVLDQLVGEVCRPTFVSTWLRHTLGERP